MKKNKFKQKYQMKNQKVSQKIEWKYSNYEREKKDETLRDSISEDRTEKMEQR